MKRTLEEVLQDFMGCPNPFDEDGSVTEHGWKAYADSEKSGREYERVVKYVQSILEEEKQ